MRCVTLDSDHDMDVFTSFAGLVNHGNVPRGGWGGSACWRHCSQMYGPQLPNRSKSKKQQPHAVQTKSRWDCVSHPSTYVWEDELALS